jgi:hypothetical protein
LGNRVAIEYKEHCVHGGLSESTESPAISKIQKLSVLMRQNKILPCIDLLHIRSESSYFAGAT